jgi:hypothetical protein
MIDRVNVAPPHPREDSPRVQRLIAIHVTENGPTSRTELESTYGDIGPDVEDAIRQLYEHQVIQIDGEIVSATPSLLYLDALSMITV